MENNAKRRIYDALNVMISASIINKHNKIISINHKLNNINNN